MNYKVKFTDTAKDDLLNIATYIAEQSKDKQLPFALSMSFGKRQNNLNCFPKAALCPMTE